MHHRLIQLGDLDALYAIYMDPENNPFLSYDPMDIGSFRPIFEERFGAADTYLVFDEGDVIATFALHRQKHRSAHVATLGSFAMHPTFRGRGYAARVMQLIVDVTRSKGVRRLDLLVETDNPRAILFYERNGFLREGILRGAVRRANEAEDVDELSMARRL